MRHSIAYALAAIAGVSLLSSPSSAQTAGGMAIEAPHINNIVGGAIGIVPDYVGSDDYTIGAAPVARIQIGKGERYAKLLVTELSVNVLDNKNWSVGPLVNYRLGRDDDVDDSVVKNMKKIDDSLEVGVFGGWTWISKKDPRARLSTGISARQDVTDGHDGYLIDASVRYWHPIGKGFLLNTGVSTTYGSGNYMDTYFGVDARDATVTGLSLFDADAGFRDIRISVMGIQFLNEHWAVAGGGLYGRLLGDAKDSPVVDDRGDANMWFVGAGVVYAW